MKLSVIIPIYRVPTTLNRCVESVLAQTVTDMEVILVDDGSPDECPEMCDKWARKDPRIRIIHKPNGGLSDARNAGIDTAQGEYITFVDSDDYLQQQTYEQVMPYLKDADIVEFPVFWHYGGKNQQLRSFGNIVYDNMKDYWLNGRAYEHTYAWNKIYRRELFCDVRFPVGLLFEDVATLPLLLAKAKRVKTVGCGLYYYYHNTEGITTTAGGRELTMLLEHHLKIIPQWCDDRYYMHVLNIQIDVCDQTGLNPLLPFRRVRPWSKNLSNVIRLKALILNIIGIKTLCRLNQIIHKILRCRS